MDDPIDINPDAHIYTGSKADWYDISDELPQFEQGRKSNDLLILRPMVAK